MAKFEVSLVLAKRKNQEEVYTENLNFICFCKDTYDREEIDDKADELIADQISESEDQILFGSAHIIIKNKHVSTISFQNKDCNKEQVEKLLDLILDDTKETVH